MKKTGWFALFVVILVGATYYFEMYRPKQQESQKQQDQLVVNLQAAQINQIRIQNPHGNFLLKRSVDGWQLEEPLKDWADNTYTDDFVAAMTKEKSLDIAANGGTINWAIYGLEHPPATVTFTAQDGKNVVVEVSTKKNFEGNAFLRKDRENKVMVAGSQWIDRTDKTALDFRDKRLYRGKISGVDKMDVHSADEKFTLVHKDNKWTVVEHPELKLDQNVVHEILTSLNEVRAKDFVTEVPAKSKQVASLQLTMPDKTWKVDFKEAPDKAIYAVVSDPAFILKMDPGQSGQYIHMNVATLRDRSEAFAIDPSAVARIELHTKLKKTILLRQGTAWKIEGDEKTAVDAPKIMAFLEQLKDSRVTQYVDVKERALFKDPENKIVLKKDNGDLVAEISWGPLLPQVGKGGLEKPLILAKSSLYKEVFALDSSVIDSWNLLGLTIPKSQEMAPPAAKDAK